ncbi:unnamed protein product [Darwinula stevensoni]|uniref:C-type lectin domain-containing protein n=1 Tax=Darwinula stevensoni TaxID=69355 RepID=A0A7R9FRT8_9CRUS|nr:unnamed protein product [Darwinula stevensoni]CAG0902371.1 unnamed protein product [Darwinula stevensoni]
MHSLVPQGYEFAMLTDKLHFLKSRSQQMNYNASRSDCTADGADLIMDDKGQAWHDFVYNFSKTTFGSGYGHAWLGASDQVKEGTWVWVRVFEPHRLVQNDINGNSRFSTLWRRVTTAHYIPVARALD